MKPLLRVARANPGRGGVVEIPIAVPELLRLDRTAGGGDGSLSVDEDLFRQVVDNFSRRGVPVPAYLGHIPRKDRRTTPAAGFVEKVWVEDGMLWGAVDLGPEAFDKVVVQRGFRAASVEIESDLEEPTVTLEGWALTGLAITNTPALPVQWVAAEGKTSDSPPRLVRLTTPLQIAAEKEHGMSDLEKLQAEKAALERSKVEAEKARQTAEAEKADLSKKLVALEAQLADAKKGGDEVAGLKVQLEAVKAEQAKAAAALEARDARDAIDGAIKAGKLLPAQVEGWKDDPVKSIKALGFSSTEGFAKFFEKAPVVVKLGQTTSSGEPNQVTAGGPQQKLTLEANKIAAERKCTFAEALDQIKATNPTLYAEGIADYAAPGFRAAD